MGRRRDDNGETRRRKEGYFEEEERGDQSRKCFDDALAEKQGLPLRNQASNALGKAHLQRHLDPFQNRHIEWLVSGSLRRGDFRYGHTSGTAAKSSSFELCR